MHNDLSLRMTDVPSHLIDVDKSLGFENMRGQDIIIPRLKLIQALSPETDAGTAKPGDILDSLSAQIVIPKDEQASIIPVFHYLEWIEWAARSSNEGILSRSLDPQSALAQSVMNQEKVILDDREVWRVTEYHQFIVLVPSISISMPVAIGCAKTNHKKGRQLLALARYRGPKPLFAGRYKMTSKKETNKQNQSYFVFEFTNDESQPWTSEEEFIAAKACYEGAKEAYDDRRIQTHMDNEITGEELNETEM